MVVHFYPPLPWLLGAGGMGVWFSRLKPLLWGGRGVWKGERHPHTPYPHIIFVTYPPVFIPLVFFQNKGLGVWNLGFPTPNFKVWGYRRKLDHRPRTF